VKIVLPHEFEPRDYQLDILKEFFINKKKNFINVWHRRAGKDKLWWNIMIAASQQRVGGYYYMFPKLKQARKVIWDGMDKEGKRFLSHIPKELIEHQNGVEMKIFLKNGSLIQLCGSDNYDSLMGTNTVGIVMSEYSLQKAAAWEYFRPILVENKGWVSFIFTPRGTNHGYDLYEKNKDNDEWVCNLLTVEETRKNNGERAITQKDIESVRRSGMSEQMIQQEFYCSFTAAVQGAYFADQLKRAYDQGRVKTFPIDTHRRVNTYWDIGIGDSTSLWLMQENNDIPHLIMYYENNGKELQHYINFLNDMRSKYGFVYGQHFMPHDSTNRSLQTGKSLISFAQELGLNPVVRIPRIKQKIEAIEMARGMLDRVVIHEELCSNGLSALREYHAEFYEKMGTFGTRPCHNWASHGADAFMTLAQAYDRGQSYNQSRVFRNALVVNL
jgi:hypothetical protein